HSGLAKEMLQHGGLLTEFRSETEAEIGHFPSRNRIVAGLADATVVVESPKKGGSMITAKLALDYHREVFAFPGKVGDTYSVGCNHLIRSNMAGLIESGEDLAYALGWEATTTESVSKQQNFFGELTSIEQAIVTVLEGRELAHIDWICKETQLKNSTVLANLLHLEFKGLLKAMPGSQFKLVR
ncbi:MAG: DNA-processing protein DprA, partial [Chitinophagales bacterium]